MNKMYINKPFEEIKVEGSENKIIITTSNKVYSFDNSLLFSSIISDGHELLKNKIDIVLNESSGDYHFNNAHVFLQKESKEEVEICATEESNKFIINTYTKISFDGLANIDIKVVPKGKTVNQVFGVDKDESKDYSLNKLQVRINLTNDTVKYYHYWPLFYKSQMPIYENNQVEFSKVAMSREFNQSMTMK